MANCSSVLKKALSIIVHHTPFFTANFKCSSRSTKFFMFFFLQGGFVISDIVIGCDDPIYNPSPVQELSLLNQFSSFTTLQSLVLEKQSKGAQSSMILSVRSDDLTYKISQSEISRSLLTVVRLSVRRL